METVCERLNKPPFRTIQLGQFHNGKIGMLAQQNLPDGSQVIQQLEWRDPTKQELVIVQQKPATGRDSWSLDEWMYARIRGENFWPELFSPEHLWRCLQLFQVPQFDLQAWLESQLGSDVRKHLPSQPAVPSLRTMDIWRKLRVQLDKTLDQVEPDGPNGVTSVNDMVQAALLARILSHLTFSITGTANVDEQVKWASLVLQEPDLELKDLSDRLLDKMIIHSLKQAATASQQGL